MNDKQGGEEVSAAVREVAEIRGGEERRALRWMESREAANSRRSLAGLASGFHEDVSNSSRRTAAAKG